LFLRELQFKISFASYSFTFKPFTAYELMITIIGGRGSRQSHAKLVPKPYLPLTHKRNVDNVRIFLFRVGVSEKRYGLHFALSRLSYLLGSEGLVEVFDYLIRPLEIQCSHYVCCTYIPSTPSSPTLTSTQYTPTYIPNHAAKCEFNLLETFTLCPLQH
jgi:hypothetical protein